MVIIKPDKQVLLQLISINKFIVQNSIVMLMSWKSGIKLNAGNLGNQKEEAVKDERLSQSLVKNAEFYTNIMEILYRSTARYQGKITVTLSVLKC